MHIQERLYDGFRIAGPPGLPAVEKLDAQESATAGAGDEAFEGDIIMSLEQEETLRQQKEKAQREDLIARGYHPQTPLDIESRHPAERAYWKKGPHYCGSWCGCRAAL